MSGELINSSLFYKKKNIFNKGAGGFSSQSINDLFDVNNDGEISGVEKDLMESAGTYNILESIHPAVARAFSDENFNIQKGYYLTDSQKYKKRMYELLIEKAILQNQMKDKENERKDFPELDEPNILNNEEVDNNDLEGDLKKRQYLDQNEINNQV